MHELFPFPPLFLGIWKSRKWKWNGNRKRKMEIGNGNGNAPIAGARYCASARYYIGTCRYCARHGVPHGDGTVCGDGRRHRIQPHQPRTGGPLVWLRAVYLTQLCWMKKIVLLRCDCSVMSICFLHELVRSVIWIYL